MAILCGTAYGAHSYISSGRYLFVQFRTDGSGTAIGFTIQLLAVLHVYTEIVTTNEFHTTKVYETTTELYNTTDIYENYYNTTLYDNDTMKGKYIKKCTIC